MKQHRRNRVAKVSHRCLSSMQRIVVPHNVAVLPQVLATLPVTTATAERSFSTLKRLKTYLHSSMGDDRLTSLALIHVHDETVPIDAAEIVGKYALTGPHKLYFLH